MLTIKLNYLSNTLIACYIYLHIDIYIKKKKRTIIMKIMWEITVNSILRIDRGIFLYNKKS